MHLHTTITTTTTYSSSTTVYLHQIITPPFFAPYVTVRRAVKLLQLAHDCSEYGPEMPCRAKSRHFLVGVVKMIPALIRPSSFRVYQDLQGRNGANFPRARGPYFRDEVTNESPKVSRLYLFDSC
jgi:hypothetical protein